MGVVSSIISQSFPPRLLFDPERDITDLTGRVAIVTGGNTGIGYHTIEVISGFENNQGRKLIAIIINHSSKGAVEEKCKSVYGVEVQAKGRGSNPKGETIVHIEGVMLTKDLSDVVENPH